MVLSCPSFPGHRALLDTDKWSRAWKVEGDSATAFGGMDNRHRSIRRGVGSLGKRPWAKLSDSLLHPSPAGSRIPHLETAP